MKSETIIWTAEEIAIHMKVSRDTFYEQLIKDPLFPATKISGRWCAHKENLDKYIQNRTLERSVNVMEDGKKLEVNWPAMPDWINAIARDSDSITQRWRGYVTLPEPIIEAGIWVERDRNAIPYSVIIPPAFAPNWDGPWHQSCVTRPIQTVDSDQSSENV